MSLAEQNLPACLERVIMSVEESRGAVVPPAPPDTPPASAPDVVLVSGDKLHRSMSVWNSFTLGFAVVSPVVGLYAIISVQTTVTGGGWFGALVTCLVMQLLVATVYAELSSQFPIAGGAPDTARCRTSGVSVRRRSSRKPYRANPRYPR